ncbi:metallophosphoesterase [Aureivirga sp. CE67]|uniref:metallophosphoesterase n=1 Tax=Aureivirga sp. CE67 TaxID=1788983 RepID=UPI0018CAC726|nr:metallophosphoesterase [Aureivirga sp. CE67]
MKRRKFLKKSILGTLGLGIGVGLYTWNIEPFWLEFTQQKMPLKNLPEELDGKTLIQISDLHIGDEFDYQYIIDSLEKTKEFNPDFVVYTGDFTSYHSPRQLRQLNLVMKHATKGKLGTFGVLGNHDYGANWSQKNVADATVNVLEKAGITMLRNNSEEVSGLNFIGIDDFWGTNFKPEVAMQHFDSSKANITLCHNPDVCDLDIWNDFHGWILSGHTHGGQVKPPFLPPPMLPVQNKNYTSGAFTLDQNRKLYINRALGCIKHIRFNVRPEITIFTLEREA